MHPSIALNSEAAIRNVRTLQLAGRAVNLALIAALGITSVGLGAEPMTAIPDLRLVADGAKDQDDACIWVHPDDGAQSVIIASDKSGGKIVVYDLKGRILQMLAVTKPGNIDLRQHVKLDGYTGDLVVVNQRSGGFRLQVYRFDPTARTLERIDDDQLLTGPNYGGCLYHSRTTGKLYFLSTKNIPDASSATAPSHFCNCQLRVKRPVTRPFPLPTISCCSTFPSPAFEGEFSIEGAVGTDGIDVTSANLGPDFPKGLFVCHTDRAPRPLLVTPWQKIFPRR